MFMCHKRISISSQNPSIPISKLLIRIPNNSFIFVSHEIVFPSSSPPPPPLDSEDPISQSTVVPTKASNTNYKNDSTMYSYSPAQSKYPRVARFDWQNSESPFRHPHSNFAYLTIWPLGHRQFALLRAMSWPSRGGWWRFRWWWHGVSSLPRRYGREEDGGGVFVRDVSHPMSKWWKGRIDQCLYHIISYRMNRIYIYINNFIE